MPTIRDDLLNAALRLSESERLMIAARLMETLPDDPPGFAADEASYLAELDRRSGDLEGSVAWQDLRTELSQES